MTNEEAIKALRFEGGLEISGNARRLAEFLDGISVAINVLRSIPTNIDLEDWIAEWVEDGECDYKPYRILDAEKRKKHKCSKCGYKAGRRTSQKYCPSCGRAMTPEARDDLKKRIR